MPNGLDHNALKLVQRPEEAKPAYDVALAAADTPDPDHLSPRVTSLLAHHARIAAFLRIAIYKTRRAFIRTPWEIDRIFGLGVFGLGCVFYGSPTQVVHFGFRFLAPIITPASWAVMMIGLTQMVVGIMEWSRARQWAAFACFIVYAAISRNNDSPTGEWIYGVCALAESLIVLKRY